MHDRYISCSQVSQALAELAKRLEKLEDCIKKVSKQQIIVNTRRKLDTLKS